jgi:uncharacterized protein
MSGRPPGSSRSGSEMDRLPAMGHYVLGLLRRGSNPPSMSAKAENRLQEAHLAHLRRLKEQGDLIVYGPIEGNSDLRGILVFRTESLDRARDLMRNDPWVIRGVLVLDLFSWFAPSGLELRSPSVSPTAPDVPADS